MPTMTPEQFLEAQKAVEAGIHAYKMKWAIIDLVVLLVIAFFWWMFHDK